MLRPLNVTNTDGGQTNYSYVDTVNAVSVAKAVLLDSSHSILNTSYMDGLGRVKQTKLTDPADGDTFVDTTYDAVGHVASTSNPHRSATLPTDGTTSYQYDALGRKVLEVPPDGSATANNVQTVYGTQTSAPMGETTTVTDQAGHARMTVADSLARLAEVWEPDPSSGSLVNATLYQYDVLGNLLCVEQHGNVSGTGCSSSPSNDATSSWRVRRFSYDSLSRLLTAKNPESGTYTWTYDSDSNVLTKSDNRGFVINYSPSASPIDQLHRVTQKTYSNGDATVNYYYDQTSYDGLTITNGVGHQTGMSDGTGMAAWTFDTEGRKLQETRTVNISGVTPSAVTKSLVYAYNLDGSQKSLTYPSGHRVDYSYYPSGQLNYTAGRPVQAVDSTGAVVNYVTSATYAPHGQIATFVNGANGSFAGISTANSWNSRLQPTNFSASTQGSGGRTVLSLSFNFNLGVQDNGLLVKINNNLQTGRSTNYKYDQLNRITGAWHDATDWGTTYGIDIWANLGSKAACTVAICGSTKTSNDSLTAAANQYNYLVGYPYDAVGNITNDLVGHTYSYDAENRPYSAGGVNYYYDGEGERVAKSSGKLYLFGTGSAPVVETDANGNWTAEYIFFDGRRVAMRKSDSSVHYYFVDQVGSANIVTNADASVTEQDIEYHPYGEEQTYTDSLGQEYRFTGKEHDPESNNDYFGARYYSSTLGRFMTPDWAATPMPVPYANPANPQTLNLYQYVENNPITGIDPDGHWDWDDIRRTVGGALNAFNEANGADLKPKLPENALGRAIGNTVAAGQGFLEVVGGASMTAAGTAEAIGTSPAIAGGPVGALVPAAGVGTAVLGVGVAAHGSIVLGSAINQMASSDNQQGGSGRSKNDVKPDPNASGAHSVPKKDSNGKTVGYTTFNDKGGAVKRVDVTGGSHGGVPTPHVHEPKPGKGPGAPLRHVRAAHPDELPK